MVGFITIPYEDERIKKLEQDLTAAYACIVEIDRYCDTDRITGVHQQVISKAWEKHKELISKARS
jgi:hypothetical protein